MGNEKKQSVTFRIEKSAEKIQENALEKNHQTLKLIAPKTFVNTMTI